MAIVCGLNPVFDAFWMPFGAPLGSLSAFMQYMVTLLPRATDGPLKLRLALFYRCLP
jgi:hypothetical protein